MAVAAVRARAARARDGGRDALLHGGGLSRSRKAGRPRA